MPNFLQPLHESNDCHEPAGSPDGGRFCSSGGGAAGAVECGEPGQCFANANRWNARHGADTDTVVHGKVTNIEGKTFDHAWIERADGTVIDPTSGVTVSKPKYYELLDAQPEASYSSTEAVRNQIRAGHHGPWTPEETQQPKPKDPVMALRSKEKLTEDYVAKVRTWGAANFIDPRETVIDNEAIVEVRPQWGKVYLTGLRVVEQKKGTGTRLMTRLTQLADEMGVTLTLNARPLDVPPGQKKIPQKKLVEFYKRFGFTGRASDMARKPR